MARDGREVVVQRHPSSPVLVHQELGKKGKLLPCAKEEVGEDARWTSWERVFHRCGAPTEKGFLLQHHS